MRAGLGSETGKYCLQVKIFGYTVHGLVCIVLACVVWLGLCVRIESDLRDNNFGVVVIPCRMKSLDGKLELRLNGEFPPLPPLL